jgi:flagellar hook protein FlgE
LGSGTQVSSIETNFSNGSPNATGVDTDVALQGKGFFVISDRSSNLLTRAGNFQMDSKGNLITSNGLNVMGFPTLNGVVKTNGSLAPINIPENQVEPPKATTSFGMNAILNSQSPVGASASGAVPVYDSLGNSYQATITYTKVGTNAWSYSISLPDNLQAAPATAAAGATLPVNAAPLATNVTTGATVFAPTPATILSTLTAATPAATASASTLNSAAAIPVTLTSTLAQSSNALAGTTTLTYGFGASGTVGSGTTLTITGPATAGGTATIVAPAVVPGESLATYITALQGALATAGIATGAGGVNITASGTQLQISGPTATLAAAGIVQQDVAGNTMNYNFVTSSGSLATVDPASTLAITEGAIGPVTAPPFAAGETVANYATALQGALTTAGITDVTVMNNNGRLSITGPAAASITGNLNQDFSGTQTSYTFGSYTDPTTQLTAQATIDPATNLTITGPTVGGGTATIVAPTITPPVTVAQYATALTNALGVAGITGVTVSSNGGQLSIVGPTTMVTSGSVQQDMKGTTNVYGFNSNGTVDPATNLTITGATAAGGRATIVAPTITAGETVTKYAADLTAALTAAGITNTTVSASNNQLSIVGASISLSGGVSQNLADTAINYDFGATATVNPATNLTITGPAIAGGMATITAPPITAGETVTKYAADLTAALGAAGIVTGPKGVTVTANGGQLSIVGPATTLSTAGTASQDLTANTISYNFGASGGQFATVDPATNLTITGLTSNGSTATIGAPTVVAGETVATYATALQAAVLAAGIAGVNVTSTNGTLSITGAGMSTTGKVIQEPVASAGASGTLTFDSKGNLVSPATDVSSVSFTGLSDGAAPMNLTWDLFGTNGTANISQVAQNSVTSNYIQDGYATGEYSGFSIGSDGTVTANFSNGQTQAVGQLALADVANLQGLKDLGNGDYASTLASGTPSIGTSGNNGLGTMENRALEGSNVNISAEFANLIIAQRAFEANSKAVTTFDTVTQETINMIH